MRILKISQKSSEKNHKPKKKQDHDGSSKKVEAQETLVILVRFVNRLITMQKNVGTKASPNVTFVKSLATLKSIVGTGNGSKQIFVKNMRKKGKKIFYLLLNLMFHQKNNECYVDSGCSNHMTGDEKAFLSINNSITTKVKMGN